MLSEGVGAHVCIYNSIEKSAIFFANQRLIGNLSVFFSFFVAILIRATMRYLIINLHYLIMDE